MYTNVEDPDPDPVCHFDAAPHPTFHFDADPDLGVQKKAQNLEKVLKETVSRDFLLLVFFMNHFPPSP